MMKTKSLFVNVAISLAILICGIVVGRFLLSAKSEPPPKKYEYMGEIKTGFPPEKPLDHRISNYKNINKVGAVPDAATAYEIGNAILIATYGKNKIDYSESFGIQLQDGFMWTVRAQSQNTDFLFYYEIGIDKRDGRIDHMTVEI
ncbi:hypothetical protein [Prevotella sp.]|uniref:hypothetical protein n=1 Tax=Prevotella sp. TaxID=59823 RepID=UPI0026483E0D|nr:hypothetical protein [Prevotella sp.]MDN5554861.1 YbbC/YhhH family protein [Prevotella sp.]